MATSGSDNFNQTRNELVYDALSLIGVYGIGRTISSEDMSFCTNMLNKMIKAWQAKGIHLWAKEEGILFIADNTAEYTLSNASSSARVTSKADAVITELDGAAASGATSLTVTSTTGMATSDIIGIVQDNDVINWTTISTIPTATTLTIASGLSAAAADNSNVYTFTSRINKPLRILSMRRITGIDAGSTTTKSEIPMMPLSHEEYFDLPSKTQNAANPTHFYYNPDLTSGTLHLWPRPSDPEVYFGFTYERALEDFDASTDNPDLPTEWLEVMTYQLAVRVAPAFGKDEKSMALLIPMASAMLEDMLNWDTEVTPIKLMPNLRS